MFARHLEAAGIADDVDGYLFRTARRKIGQLTTNPLYCRARFEPIT
jgi:hypothetical protein